METQGGFSQRLRSSSGSLIKASLDFPSNQTGMSVPLRTAVKQTFLFVHAQREVEKEAVLVPYVGHQGGLELLEPGESDSL